MLTQLFMALAAIIPSIILLLWFRNSDLFPEPWPVIRKVFWQPALKNS